MRERSSIALAVIVCALTVVVSGQTAPTTQTPTPTVPNPTLAGNRTDPIVLIGCLRMTQGSGGAVTFNFADSRANDPRAGQRGPIPSAWVNAAADQKIPGRYRLTGDETLLKQHNGHQVEIVGSVEPGSAASVAGAEPETFKVQILKWLSATCWTTTP